MSNYPEIHDVQKNSESEPLSKVRHFWAKAVIFGRKSHRRYITFIKIQKVNRYTKWGIFGQKRSFSVEKVIADTSRSKKFRKWTAIQSEAFSGKSGRFRSKKSPQIGSMYYFRRAHLKWGIFQCTCISNQLYITITNFDFVLIEEFLCVEWYLLLHLCT